MNGTKQTYQETPQLQGNVWSFGTVVTRSGSLYHVCMGNLKIWLLFERVKSSSDLIKLCIVLYNKGIKQTALQDKRLQRLVHSNKVSLAIPPKCGLCWTFSIVVKWLLYAADQTTHENSSLQANKYWI